MNGLLRNILFANGAPISLLKICATYKIRQHMTPRHRLFGCLLINRVSVGSLSGGCIALSISKRLTSDCLPLLLTLCLSVSRNFVSELLGRNNKQLVSYINLKKLLTDNLII